MTVWYAVNIFYQVPILDSFGKLWIQWIAYRLKSFYTNINLTKTKLINFTLYVLLTEPYNNWMNNWWALFRLLQDDNILNSVMMFDTVLWKDVDEQRTTTESLCQFWHEQESIQTVQTFAKASQYWTKWKNHGMYSAVNMA